MHIPASSPFMRPPGKPAIRFGEQFNDQTLGGVAWNPNSSGESVTNWKDPSNGKIFPLMVGLRPSQEALLQQVADNTAALKTSMDTLARALQSRFNPNL